MRSIRKLYIYKYEISIEFEFIVCMRVFDASGRMFYLLSKTIVLVTLDSRRVFESTILKRSNSVRRTNRSERLPDRSSALTKFAVRCWNLRNSRMGDEIVSITRRNRRHVSPVAPSRKSKTCEATAVTVEISVV